MCLPVALAAAWRQASVWRLRMFHHARVSAALNVVAGTQRRTSDAHRSAASVGTRVLIPLRTVTTMPSNDDYLDRLWNEVVNIVDFGLVYSMEMTKLAEGSHRVGVKMTLTAPGCGMGPSIAGDAEQKLLSLDGVDEARVEIVWDPQRHQSMITPEGRRLLGIE